MIDKPLFSADKISFLFLLHIPKKRATFTENIEDIKHELERVSYLIFETYFICKHFNPIFFEFLFSNVFFCRFFFSILWSIYRMVYADKLNK